MADNRFDRRRDRLKRLPSVIGALALALAATPQVRLGIQVAGTPDSEITVSPADPTTKDQITFTVKAEDTSRTGLKRIILLVNDKEVKSCLTSPCSYFGGPYPEWPLIEKAPGAGEAWIKLMNELSDNAVRGTKVVVPKLGLDNEETLALGGLHFRLHHNGQAHTDGDLMIEVLEEKVLFLGDIVVHERAGRMDDGSFKGNIAACELALKTDAKIFVPGHGQSDGREVVIADRDWHQKLYGAVKKYQAKGLSDFEMKDKIVAELKPHHKWAMFDTEIGKLVSLANLQAEQESF